MGKDAKTRQRVYLSPRSWIDRVNQRHQQTLWKYCSSEIPQAHNTTNGFTTHHPPWTLRCYMTRMSTVRKIGTMKQTGIIASCSHFLKFCQVFLMSQLWFVIWCVMLEKEFYTQRQHQLLEATNFYRFILIIILGGFRTFLTYHERWDPVCGYCFFARPKVRLLEKTFSSETPHFSFISPQYQITWKTCPESLKTNQT